MASNRNKYTPEFRESTAKFIIENNRSATSFAEEAGIDINTVCRWVRDYRRKHKLPSYAQSKGIVYRQKSDSELLYEKKELEKELKREKRLRLEEAEKVEILKKSLAIFMQQT